MTESLKKKILKKEIFKEIYMKKKKILNENFKEKKKIF